MAMATGDAIIVIDSDLQDPPQMIHTFVEHWEQGYDVVYGVRMKREGDPPFRVFLTMNAMWLISWLADYPLPPHSSDFRLITRQVRDAFIDLPERSRYVRGMIHWVGFKQIGIPYTREGRKFDEENRRWGAGVWSLLNFALDAIFSFSLKPLRIFTAFGLGGMLLAVVLTVVYLTLFVIDPTVPRGWTTLAILLLFQFAMTSLGIGILGEYVGRIYMETKQRPNWIINYTRNFDSVNEETVD